MISLTNIFDDIIADFNKSQYASSSVLSRRFILKGKSVVFISVYKYSRACEVRISIPDGVSKDTLKSLPKWKGMEERLSNIPDDNNTKQFLSFKQLDDYERKIFILVMQDIIDRIEEVENKDVVWKVKEVLAKWNTFFQFDKEYVLQENTQQGLYGELYILEKMVALKDESVLNCWTGCNAETHDFYFGRDALEVKSSSSKGPDKVKISNEFQLDDTGILGRLYLMYLKMKKSEVDGECLPDIVERIVKMLGADAKISFYDKLIKVGYMYQMPELYTVHFKIREENCYSVEEGFPKITTKTISKGIGSVDYVVSLDACNSFLITVESFYEGVDI
ncbi:Putative PD-(D/E)XK family member [Anaerobium acetethylicum]|uniref:Putative PD-(D/E)XK family member n=2 Tax=Anaerobium acetethylicum TaxID=1619234 RepID=A0A1D3TWH0_9FIRM|nr:Putative PD-(D/E)XK family member [Anaerobium acetethylicum]